jgi:thiol:disulfide interchange protein DsbD
VKRWLVLLGLLAFTPARAQDAGITVTGLLSHDKVAPGQAFRLAVVLNLPAPWHCNANPASQPEFIPTTVSFNATPSVTIGKITYPAGQVEKVSWSDTPVALYSGKVAIIAEGKLTGTGPVTITGTVKYQACDDQVCYAPKTVPVAWRVEPGSGGQAIHPDIFRVGASPVEPLPATQPATRPPNSIADRLQTHGLWLTLVFIFFGGLALNLTPCVYPMIAITVSYFGGQGERSTGQAFRHALAYFFGVTLTYSALGLVAALTGGLFGALLQNQWVLIGIASLLLALALSMFGLFEIQPPQFLMQKAAGLSGKTGYIGVFFLGATVGVIAAPCLAPILVALLAYVSQRGDPWLGWGMFFVLACGLALPYVVLGTFSGALARLPKSGTWMVWVKRIFGVILIGAAAWVTMPLWQPHGVSWPPYSRAAVQQAAAEHKPVVIDFSATWCGPCRQMERTTFRDPRVIAAGATAVFLKADVTATESPDVKALMDHYQIRGVPTLVFLDPDGKEHAELRRAEYTSAAALLELIKRSHSLASPAGNAGPVPPALADPF